MSTLPESGAPDSVGPIASPTRHFLNPMRPRDPNEPGRAASTLELFFDLVFVVAVSIASVQLHHALTEGHIAHGLLNYALVFFAIWWAWMNFTWFATSFDNDDWLYRVMTIVQMGGVLVLAAGIPPLFEDGNIRGIILGYVVMRVAMVGQWLRAASSSPSLRSTCLTYAIGITVVQVLWLTLLALPDAVRPFLFVVLVIGELMIPVIAENRGDVTTPAHPHHITERYGLFTLILLGESLLGSANAIIDAVHEHDALVPLILLSILALVVTAGLWWIYFWPPHHRALRSLGATWRYGYVHYFVFAAAGALSAGIEVEIDVEQGKSHLSEVAGSFTFTIPIAVFVLGIWWLALRDNADRVVNTAIPVGAVLILLDPLIPVPFALTTIIIVAMVAVLVVHPPLRRSTADHG